MTKLYNFYCRAYQAVMRIGTKALDWSEPQLFKGAGSVKKLPEVVKSLGIDRVLVVTDGGLTKLGLLNPMLEELKKTGVEFFVYDGTQPNPTIDNIEQAHEIYLKNACKGIIAFGGGSPMDCAKATGARIARPNKPIQKMRGQLKVLKKLPPLFAIPTTAGTGSETTIAAVVSDPKTHEKYAINDPVLRPKYAVLDAELTVGLPKHITSTTGMDALTHAVEAYIGGSNTKGTIAAAEKATKLIFENLPAAYENGADLVARGNMLEASYLAGVAFTRAYVGYVHAIAHNLGGLYGTPHGLANAIILPHVLEFFGASAYNRLARLAECAGIVTNESTDEQKAKLFIEKIKLFNKTMNIPEKFDMIKDEDIPLLAKRALREANPLYPVPKIMDIKDCEKLIKSLQA